MERCPSQSIRFCFEVLQVQVVARYATECGGEQWTDDFRAHLDDAIRAECSPGLSRRKVRDPDQSRRRTYAAWRLCYCTHEVQYAGDFPRPMALRICEAAPVELQCGMPALTAAPLFGSSEEYAYNNRVWLLRSPQWIASERPRRVKRPSHDSELTRRLGGHGCLLKH
jgi:hypothetical protein